MTREARLREIVRLEHDLVNITRRNYFEKIEYWLRDIDEETIRAYVEGWVDIAADLGGSCQIASGAVDKLLGEWSAIERWLQHIGTRQKLQEENAAIHRWSIWRSDSRENISPTTIALAACLEPILHCTQDLKQTIDLLGSFWDKLSSDIRSIPPNMISNDRAVMISSGRGQELITQWSVVSDLMKKVFIDRSNAVDLIRLGPPAVRSTGSGQCIELPLTPALLLILITIGLQNLRP